MRKIKTSKIKASRVKRRLGDGAKAVKIRTESNRRPLKTIIVALLVVLQIAFLIALNVLVGMAFNIYLALSFALSLVMCILCLSSERNGLSKTVWTILLIVGFSFGFILYIMSDERVCNRGAKKRYKAVYDRTAKYCPEYVLPNASASVVNDSKFLYSAGKFCAYSGTAVKYFPSGAQLFDDMLEELEKAKQFIFIEFFIISDGALLNRVSEILIKKAQNGVKVRVLYDDMGCHSVLSRKTKKRLSKGGVKLAAFNRLKPVFDAAMNYRDHRKIVVIDGKTAYTGGSNLADEYTNEKRMRGYWKDTGVRLDGAAVDAFTLMFLRQWEFITKTQEGYAQYLNNFDAYDCVGTVIPFADGLDFKANICKSVYENVISGARERLWIMTPYFVPDDITFTLLKNKARSGVDVRIILPAVPDKVLTYAVTRNNAEKLISSGVKVYCMNYSFVHGKLCLSENAAVISSANFDLRSFYQQFENGVYTDDGEVLTAVFADFENTFKKCALLDETSARRAKLINRAVAGVLQLFAPLM